MTLIPPQELLLATALITAGDENAERSLGHLVERFPQDPNAHFLLGALQQRHARYGQALTALDRALELEPRHVQALSAKAAVLDALGRREEAASMLSAAVECQPGIAQLWTNLARVRESLNDLTGALAAYDQALALPSAPLAAYLNRGYTLARLGRLDDALENNQRLATLHPHRADAHFNVAEVLMALDRPRDALKACGDALRNDAAHSKAMIVRGLASAQLDRLDEAREAFELVRKRDPDAIRNFVNAFEPGGSDDLGRFDPELIYLSNAYRPLHRCDWARRSDLVQRFARLAREQSEAPRGLPDPALAYNALTLPLADAQRLAIARGVAMRLEAIAASVPSPPVASPQMASAKIRVGYLSPDIRDHLNAYLLRPLLELHDRSRFEVICYSTGVADRSPIRQRVEAAADKFVDASRVGDADLAGRISADGIDVLVDAGGYTTYARPGVLARRPAPVQVGYLAFPGTQAMEAVPWRIVDRIASPPEQKTAWTESLVYLPDTFFIYDRFEALPDVSLSRREYGLPDDAFVFCSFNNYYKIEPEIFGIWMELLRQVPSSVLWLAGRDPVAAANLRKEAAPHGVPAERLVFAPFESRERYRARFRLADLFLDTPIFNAMTTACDALAAGLPVLTVRGSSFPARVAASVLSAAGFPDGIVDSLEHYREQALAWSAYPGVLARLRRAKLANPMTAPLFDTVGRVRQLETAYAEMWRRHQKGLAPESFDVIASAASNAPWSRRWY